MTMIEFSEPASPTIPANFGYGADVNGADCYASTGMTKLQYVASKILAALVTHPELDLTALAPLRDEDVAPDEDGLYYKDEKGHYRIDNGSRKLPRPHGRFRIIATYEQRLARQAVRYAKALLEAAGP